MKKFSKSTALNSFETGCHVWQVWLIRKAFKRVLMWTVTPSFCFDGKWKRETAECATKSNSEPSRNKKCQLYLNITWLERTVLSSVGSPLPSDYRFRRAKSKTDVLNVNWHLQVPRFVWLAEPNSKICSLVWAFKSQRWKAAQKKSFTTKLCQRKKSSPLRKH